MILWSLIIIIEFIVMSYISFSCYTDLLAPASPSVSKLTASSVIVSWTEPVGGLRVDIYRVTLTTISVGMCSGVSLSGESTTTSTSIMINGLGENSIYTVTISAVNNEFNVVRSISGPTITTLEAGVFMYILVRVLSRIMHSCQPSWNVPNLHP